VLVLQHGVAKRHWGHCDDSHVHAPLTHCR